MQYEIDEKSEHKSLFSQPERNYLRMTIKTNQKRRASQRTLTTMAAYAT